MDYHTAMKNQKMSPGNFSPYHAWEPGNYGKGIVLGNDVHTWNTTGNRGGPHHQEYVQEALGDYVEMGETPAFFIDPKGRYVLPDYWLYRMNGPRKENALRRAHKLIKEQTGLTTEHEDTVPVNLERWTFSRFKQWLKNSGDQLNVIQVSPSSQGEKPDSAAPVIFDESNNNIYIGEPGTYHSSILPMIGIGVRLEYLHSGLVWPQDSSNPGLVWYEKPPERNEEIAQALGVPMGFQETETWSSPGIFGRTIPESRWNFSMQQD